MIAFLLIVLFWPAWALAATGSSAVDTFYVRPAADCPNNGDGLAYTCAGSPGASGAFSVLTNVVWTSTTGVDDGDTLYVCGTHPGYLAVGSSAAGTAASPITINYACPNDPGSIRAITTMTEAATAGNWTNESGNLWYLSTSGYTWADPRRLWTDSTERMRASIKANLGTSEGGPVGYWWYDSGNTRVYVYSTANPATTFSTMESLVAGSGTGSYGALSLVSATNQHFRIIDPTLEGGNFASLVLLGSHISVTGSEEDDSACHIGGYAIRAVEIADTQTDGSGTPSRANRVQDCTIASLAPAEFDNYTWQCCANEGVNLVYGTSENDVESNTIVNWSHTGVQMAGTLGAGTVTNNRIRFNTIRCDQHIEYCRGVAIDGSALGDATGNSIIGNVLDGMSIRSQINGNGNFIIGNVCKNQRVGTVNTAAAQCFDMEGYAGPSQDNVFAHNLCIGNAYGAFLQIQSGGNTKSGMKIYNNMAVDCGGDAGQVAGSAGAAFAIESAASVGNQEFKNNIIYSSTTSNTVFYKGTGLTTVSGFQSACSGDVCSGNLSSDPLLNSTTDFRLQLSSPAVRAGVMGVCRDVRDRACSSTAPNIGAYQSTSGDPAATRAVRN